MTLKLKKNYNILVKQKKLSKQKQKNDDDFHQIFNEWRAYDFCSSLFAMIGLIVGLINYELDAFNEELIFTC